MRLTKTIRHKVYLEALESLQQFPTFGLCSALDDGIRKYDLRKNIFQSMAIFPEVYKHKPEVMYNQSWWFNPQELNVRKEILLQAIEDTSHIKHTKQ